MPRSKDLLLLFQSSEGWSHSPTYVAASKSKPEESFAAGERFVWVREIVPVSLSFARVPQNGNPKLPTFIV